MAPKCLTKTTSQPELFPNPTSQSTTLEFDSPVAHMASLTIMDALGRVVETKALAVNQGHNLTTVDASTMETGTYVVQIHVDGQVLVNEKLFVSAR